MHQPDLNISARASAQSFENLVSTKAARRTTPPGEKSWNEKVVRCPDSGKASSLCGNARARGRLQVDVDQRWIESTRGASDVTSPDAVNVNQAVPSSMHRTRLDNQIAAITHNGRTHAISTQEQGAVMSFVVPDSVAKRTRGASKGSRSAGPGGASRCRA